MMNICSVLRLACFSCQKKSLLTAVTQTNVERESTDKSPKIKTINQTKGLDHFSTNN